MFTPTLLACGAGEQQPRGDSSGGSATTGGSSGTGGSGGIATGGMTGDGGNAASSSGGAASGGTSGSANAGCSDLPVCDDFEAASAPDAATWSLQLDYGGNGNPANVVIDSAIEAHSGENSLKVVGPANAPFFIVNTTALPAPNDSVYVRAYVRLAAPLPVAHTVLISAGIDDSNEARVGGISTFLTANLVPGDGIAPAAATTGSCPACAVLPTEQWVCLEALFDNQNDVMRVWMNEVEVVTVDDAGDWHASSTWPASLNKIKLGFLGLGGASGTVWYDDIAIGYARIGCD
jgi:hypothetical protein